MEGMVKIKIMLPETDWHLYKVEVVWAEPLGDNLYRVGNSPFFADNISYHDIIFAIANEEDGPLIFKSVRERSGNSTYRIILAGETTYDMFRDFMQPLADIGCSYESLKGFHFTLKVPLGVSLKEVELLLKKGAADGILIFEASHQYNVEEEL